MASNTSTDARVPVPWITSLSAILLFYKYTFYTGGTYPVYRHLDKQNIKISGGIVNISLTWGEHLRLNALCQEGLVRSGYSRTRYRRILP